MKIAVFFIVSCTYLFPAEFMVAGSDSSYNIIIHTTNPVSELTVAKISTYFLKKSTKWGNGKTVNPVHLKRSSVIRKQFTQEVIGKTPGRLETYWQRQIFSGREVPPLEKPTDAEVIRYIQETPSAIGYVSKETKLDTSQVKILKVRK